MTASRSGTINALAEVLGGAPVPVDVFAAAVDELEVAATLESCGLSNSVARDRLGLPDVFSFANQLYSEVEAKPAAATDPRLPRPGNVGDLARGLVFATPTLMFAGAAVGFRSLVSWWTMPLALICGWGFSQLVAYAGFSRAAYKEPAGPVAAWAVLGAIAVCGSLGLAGHEVLGGNIYGVALAAGASAFMAASAELVVHAKEALIAALFLPGALASLIFILHEPVALPASVAVVVAGLGVAGTFVAAARLFPRHWWRSAPLAGTNKMTAAGYFTEGLCLGLFIAILLVLEPAKGKAQSWPGMAAYPMILSLGVMEWQLRSFRSRARRRLIATRSVREFSRASRAELARSTFIYLVVLAAVTAGLDVLSKAKGIVYPETLLIAGTCLAVGFFLALMLAVCGRIDLAVKSWAPGIGVLGAWGLLVVAAGAHWSLANGRLALCIAAAVALAALIMAAGSAVTYPFSHG